MSDPNTYDSILATRYASPAMARLWSAGQRARVWRRLWLALAEEQRRLGIAIPEAALSEMRAHLDDADLEQVRVYERRLRHDVMAHIHAFGDQAPTARPFLHLGATSAFVTDNADLIIMKEALRLLVGRVLAVIGALRDFAIRYRALPTVAYTHFQPAQLTTVGKRATLWLQDFALDADTLHDLAESLPFRGCKGTTGTQASFLDLFGGDHAKVVQLDRRVAAAFGFRESLPVTGQTYTRKVDSRVLDGLAGLAQSASKFATDLRLLQHEGEIVEPAEADQVGSSAMPYKRNPVRSERICALSRYVIALRDNAAQTAATQWLERTLDDSANRRLSLPESFLAADAILVLATNVAAGLEVREATIRRNVERVMPFMATERWLMAGVQAGGDRQTLHEVIRRHARVVADAVEQGARNDLLDRLASDPAFARVDAAVLQREVDASRYVGRAPEQVTEYLEGAVRELLARLSGYATRAEAEVLV
ncbi:MAG TPA: adenylosuccinate lyase, partial [Gemmatimonadales bacterium]|nr:adenylosuccinate lyase [Gemmatimonadales bacterium]